jgi:hypothetical protein
MLRMNFRADLLLLQEFVETASFSNTAYYRVRRDLFEAWCQVIENGRDSATAITVSFETFSSVKGFLLARNEQLDDNKRLSFECSLLDLSRAAVPGDTSGARATGTPYRRGQPPTASPGPSGLAGAVARRVFGSP